MEKRMRLDKYLADMRLGSRSGVREMIRKGRVAVNGETVRTADRKICPGTDLVEADGAPVEYEAHRYILLNKPAGCLSAARDKKQKTVLDLLPPGMRKGLFPVGRLDKDTEGLLLLTDDGDLAHRLLSPARHVDKVYYARVEGCVDETDADAFREGMDIGDEKPTLPAELKILSAGDESEILLTIREGRFHQVKRMFEARGRKVIFLKRLAMGPLRLDESLAAGAWRRLSAGEQKRLEAGREPWRMLDGKKAVIFDLDGTLADSLWMWADIDVAYLSRFGLKVPDGLKREIEGMSFTETALYFRDRFGIDAAPEEMKADWLSMARDRYRRDVSLKEGAPEFLRELKARGYLTGIASSNSLELVEEFLEAQGIRSLFDSVHTCCEVRRGKPSPDIYLLVAGDLGVSPRDCLVFEDVPMGIQAGIGAGMTTCGVEDKDSADLREEKIRLADFYIENFNGIIRPKGNRGAAVPD